MKPIIVKIDSSDLITNLIRTVQHFYPLGFELTNDQYDGFIELRDIIEEKLVQARENKLPTEIGKLIADIEKMYPGIIIHLDSYSGSPSYSISIPIISQDFDSLDRSLTFTLKISLLSNYYTYFFEERVKHKNILPFNGSDPYVSTVISQEAQKEDKERKMAMQIESIFRDCFPSYQFVNHHLLFTIKTNGVPFGQDYADRKRNYLLYDFLFESGMYIDYSVLK